ncbi:hypothetical protein GCM10023189_34140 [Nibrella saemangeumensis]|uniref:Uncharacterized protein n=1 Tax=Nibrella saemangeumensis TaxID=1084526 RepID=A0ABP8N4U7_9BACT
MKQVITTASLLLMVLTVWAQTTPKGKDDKQKETNPEPVESAEAFRVRNMMLLSTDNNIMPTVDTRYEGLQGTPYFIPNWSRGQVDLTNGTHQTNVPLKFDAHRQSLLILREKMRDSIIVNPNQIKAFTIMDADGNGYLFKRYTGLTGDKQLSEGYFMVLYEGKNAMLKRVNKLFKKADFKGGYSADIRYDSYTDDVSFYLLRPDKSLVKLKKSKKAVLDALSDKKADVARFIDEKKLDFKSEYDLAQVVQYYDSL